MEPLDPTNSGENITSLHATGFGFDKAAEVASHPSIWSSIISSTFGMFESKGVENKGNTDPIAKAAGWTDFVRRAIGSGPMRRFQERMLGMKGTINGAMSGGPIWILGVCYKLEGTDREEDYVASQLEEFLKDFSSRIWITYRQGFEALGNQKLTSDVGWGCMIRSGQMLLAQALLCHHLGRSWRLESGKPYEREYLAILRGFGDFRDDAFSIHRFVDVGSPFGLAAGAWLGPYALCRTIEALACSDTAQIHDDYTGAFPMAVCVVSGDAEGGRGGAPVLYIDNVANLCTSWGRSSDDWAPLLVLVPLVLGVAKINPRYIPSLRATFYFPQSLGIAGGKPGASTYLVGVQGDQVLYLDPHEVHQAVTISHDDSSPDTSSYHCSDVCCMPLEAVDPSLALGFYCRNREDFEDFCERSSELADQSDGAPMFTIAQSFMKTEMHDGQVANTQIPYSDSDGLHEEGWQIL